MIVGLLQTFWSVLRWLMQGGRLPVIEGSES